MKDGRIEHANGRPQPDDAGNNKPVHPGSVLRRRFFDPSGFTQVAFARHIGVSRRTLCELFLEKRPMTRRTARKLDIKLGGARVPWLQLQARYDDWMNGGQQPPPGKPPADPGGSPIDREPPTRPPGAT